MKRLLLLSSDELFCKSVHLMVGHARTTVHCAEPNPDVVEVARCGEFDLILLDIDPDTPDAEQAVELLAQLRSAVPSVPFLLFTETSADVPDLQERYQPCDTLAKPFHRNDLAARIEAQTGQASNRGSDRLEFGRLVLDLTAKDVLVDGVSVSLTGKEYSILELLALRSGTTLTKSMFLTHLYPEGNEPEMKIIDVFICKLRKKLNAALGDVIYVHTVWGRGYVFRPPEAEQQEPKKLRAGA